MLQINEIYTGNSIEEIMALKSKHPQAKFLAAGTDLIPKLRSGSTEEGCELLDISRIQKLRSIEVTEDEIRIGALVTHREIGEHPLLQQEMRALTQACRQIGSLQIRNVATLGGNLANASPAGDSMPPLVAMDAEVVLITENGVKRLPLETYLQQKWEKQSTAEGLLTEVILPRQAYKSAFEKIGGRNALVISIASCAVAKGEDGYHVAFGSVNPWVKRVSELENYLNEMENRLVQDSVADKCSKNQNVDGFSREKLEEILGRNLHPIEDVRASAEYRLAVAGGLFMSVLEKIREEK